MQLDYCVKCGRGRGLGGDFCELLSMGRSLLVSMGDVEGCGSAATMVTASILGWVKGRASSNGSVSATVRDLNRDFLAMSPGNLYASLFHARFHAERAEVEYVNAGYNLVVLYRHGPRKTVVLDRTGTVLGLSVRSRFDQRTVHVGAGDILVALTDGKAEGTNERALHETVRMYSGRPSRELAGNILRAGSGAASDDRSVLVVRFVEAGVLARAA